MWAELETGSSSAGPWTMPSATARAGRDAAVAQAPLVPAGSASAGLALVGPPPRRRLTIR